MNPTPEQKIRIHKTI
ncbi:hypothetical protein NBH08_30315, partial [Faecalicatena sp. BF-R-105]|nr:hypothetical protein [Faecalicatena sp. BF-R-105]